MIRFIVAFALVLSGLGAAHAQYRHDTDYYFDRSDPLLKEQLGNVERHLQPCQQQYKEKRYEQALSDCIFILNYFPNHPQALLLLTQICDSWKNPHCIPEPYFDRALEINPNIPGTPTVIGIYLLRSKKIPEAITRLKEAVELDPNYMNAQYNLALAYIEAKQYDLANQHAQIAYQLGAPLPGLREKLRRGGHWKAVESAEAPPAGGTENPTKQQ